MILAPALIGAAAAFLLWSRAQLVRSVRQEYPATVKETS